MDEILGEFFAILNSMGKHKKSLLALFLFFFLGFAALLFYKKDLQKSTAEKKVLAINVSPSPTPIPPTPTPTPTPTPEPTATPVPKGYCLNVPVIFYHHIQPQQMAKDKGQTSISVDNGMFDLQMGYLSSHGYAAITVKQLVDALIGHSGVPAKSIAITFDDGYKDNFENAFPVLQKYHLTANLMLATGLMGGPDYLSWDQVKQMAGSGLFYFTDHTWSHYSLGKGDPAKIKFEVDTARDQIQQHTGQTVNIFTYPYGTFTPQAISFLQQDGFVGAFSTLPGTLQCDSFLMTLHRTRIGNAQLSAYGF